MLKKYTKALLAILILIGLDQWTKVMAVTHLKNQAPISVLGDAFYLHYLENPGAAFGLLANKQTLFFIITIVVLIAITFMYGKIPTTKRFLPIRICAIFIIAGALGNMIDRVMNQYVVDFFYFKLIDFPIFNVADCYVTVSIILLAILLLFVYKEEELNFLTSSKSEKQADESRKEQFKIGRAHV